MIHIWVNSMGMFGNDTLDSLFGDIFGASMPENQQKLLDDYWKHGDVQNYYNLINRIKQSGYKVFRNSQGKHLVKRG